MGTENEHPHAPLEYAPILSALFKSAEMKELIARFQGGLEAAQTEEALTAFHASAEMGGIIHRLNDVLKDLLVAINARPETVQIKEAALAFYKSAEIQDILARFGESLNDLSEFAEISILDILDRLGNALEDTEVDEAIEALFLSGDIHPLLDRLVEYARDSQIAEPVLAFLESAEKKTIWGRLQDSCKERRQAIYAHINHTTDSTQIKEAVLALSTSTAMGEIVARLKNAREELSRPAEMGEPIIITTDFTILYRIGDIVARLEDVFQAAQVKDADPIEMKTAMRLLLRDLWCLETDMRWKTYLSRDGTQSRPRSLASSL